MLRLRSGTLALAAGLGLASCSSTMEVRSLATGRPDRAAYELNGADGAALRREAQRLCPAGVEILRAASLDQAHEAVDGRIRGWLNGAADRLDPPRRAAQMMILCRGPADGSALRADLPAVGASSPVAVAGAVMPPSPSPAAPASMTSTRLAVAPPSPQPTPVSPAAAGTTRAIAAAVPPRPTAPSASTLPVVQKAPALPIGPITAEW